MRRRLLSLFCTAAVLFTMSLQVFAATSTVTSAINISAGGTGYSDTMGVLSTSLAVPYGSNGETLQYDKYNVKLVAFQFNSFSPNEKPVNNVRFNFRLVTKTSHTNAGTVVYLYSHNTSASNWIWSGYGVSGQEMAMKSNITNYSSKACTLACQWYLFMT